MNFNNNFPLWENFWYFVYTDIYCVGAGISTLTSLFNGFCPCFSRRKMGKTLITGVEIDRKVCISCQSWHFPFVIIILKVLFLICASIWRVNSYVSRQGENLNRTNESTKVKENFSLWLSAYCTDCDWLCIKSHPFPSFSQVDWNYK